jgi:uncharacterized protein (TIGR02145 family)
MKFHTLVINFIAILFLPGSFASYVSAHGIFENNIDDRSYSDKLLSGNTDSVVVGVGPILKVGLTTLKVGGYLKTNDLSVIRYVGVCWDKKKIPSSAGNNVTTKPDSARFVCNISDLDPGTLYLIRAFAVTTEDTVYSKTKAFYTHRTDAVADFDGNYYNTITIGSKKWLAEDLKTTHLNDGALIPMVTDEKFWPFLKSPAFCWYGNDSVDYSFPRGKLYNWYAVNSAKLCPSGWHVPANREWEELRDYLGGDSIAGGKLKTTGTLFWREPNYKATNESGFSAIPSGYRNSSGMFSYSTIFDNWWSSDLLPSEAADYWYVYHYTGYLYKEMSYKMFGYSVRCIKN